MSKNAIFQILNCRINISCASSERRFFEDLIGGIELLKSRVKIAKTWCFYLTPKIIDSPEHWPREVNLVGHLNPGCRTCEVPMNQGVVTWK